MLNRTTHIKGVKKTAAKKAFRIVRHTNSLPTSGHIVIKGATSTHTVKAFNFTIVSAAQQMKERNKAYQFFSI